MEDVKYLSLPTQLSLKKFIVNMILSCSDKLKLAYRHVKIHLLAMLI